MSLDKLLSSKSNLGDGHFGFEYPAKEVSNLSTQIRRINSMIIRDKALVKMYDLNMGLKDNFILNYPKLTAYQRSKYKRAKNNASRNTHKKNLLIDELSYKKLSRMVAKSMPTLDTIMKYASDKGLYPDKAVDAWEKENFLYPYPDYIIQLAKVRWQEHRTFKRTDIAPIMDSLIWFDKAVKEEDQKHIKHGAGKSPIRDLVNFRRASYKKLKANVKKMQKKLVETYVKRITRRASTTELEWLRNVEDQSTLGSDSQHYQLVSNHNAEIEYNKNIDENMGGFFKKFLKIVLSPIDKLMVSPFMMIANPVMKAVLPSSLYESVAALSQAQAQILKGNISKENLKSMVKPAMKLWGLAVRVYTYPTEKAFELSQKIGVVHNLTTNVDKYTGGLITAGEDLYATGRELQKGEKIDYRKKAISGLKVGMAAAAGAGAVAISGGGRAATDRTVLGKTSIGRGLVTVTSAYATGGSDTVQNLASNKAGAAILKKAVSKGIIKEDVARLATTTLQASQGTQGSGSVFAQNLAQKVATDESKRVATKEILERTALGNSVLGSALTTGLVSATGTDQTYAQTVNTVAQEQAKNMVDAQLQKYGLSVDKLSGLASNDKNDMMDNIKKMSEKDIHELIQKEEAKLRAKIERTTNEYEARAIEEQQKVEAELRKAEQFDSAEKTEELKRNAERDMRSQQERLGSELDRIQTDYERGLDDISKSLTDFDSSKLMEQSKNSLRNKIEAERDRFTSGYMDRLYYLKDKYGARLLAYLMWKYGPKPDYNVTPTDLVSAKTFVPPKSGRLYRTNYKMPWGKIVMAGLGIYTASKVI